MKVLLRKTHALEYLLRRLDREDAVEHPLRAGRHRLLVEQHIEGHDDAHDDVVDAAHEGVDAEVMLLMMFVICGSSVFVAHWVSWPDALTSSEVTPSISSG